MEFEGKDEMMFSRVLGNRAKEIRFRKMKIEIVGAWAKKMESE